MLSTYPTRTGNSRTWLHPSLHQQAVPLTLLNWNTFTRHTHTHTIRHPPVVDALTDISHWSTQIMGHLPSTQRSLEQHSLLVSAEDCENKQLWCQSLLSYRTLRNRQLQWLRKKKRLIGRESSGRNGKTKTEREREREREDFVLLATRTSLQSKHQPTHQNMHLTFWRLTSTIVDVPHR